MLLPVDRDPPVGRSTRETLVGLGYSVTKAASGPVPDQRHPFLQKPFTPDALARAVRDAPDAEPESRE